MSELDIIFLLVCGIGATQVVVLTIMITNILHRKYAKHGKRLAIIKYRDVDTGEIKEETIDLNSFEWG